jgi:uncharacterized protein with NAD-binding domain and iron-sulfur cluster
MAVKKVAVLGGGMGSLTAVYELTSDPDWQNKYEITIYQIGWRLGGKGASGRNGTPTTTELVSQRIEEHGLHLWFGFYDNAFDLIQRCYRDNGGNWESAFTGYDTICLEENIGNQWLHWPLSVPSNNKIPGIGDRPPTINEYNCKLLEWMAGIHNAFQSQNNKVRVRMVAPQESQQVTRAINLVEGNTMVRRRDFSNDGSFLLNGALQLCVAHDHSNLYEVLDGLKVWLENIATDLLSSDNDLRRYFIMLDLAIVTVMGIIADGVIVGGFDIINDIDYRDWLKKHKAAQVTYDSAIVQAVYGLVFGGNKQYTFEAGTALRGFLRLGLTYKGHIYYRMTDGMGDAIFSPLYEVLLKRGVKFEFFHKVTKLGLSANGQSIDTISIDVQAGIKAGHAPYYPFVMVGGLPCWPTKPNYEHLYEGDDLKTQNVNLESYYSTWRSRQTPKVLRANTDFDIVLLGIAIGALPTITREFTSPAWRDMIANVIPISTVAFQAWLKPSIEEMKWPFTHLGLALVGSYQQPHDTYADMSHLLLREPWPSGYKPKHVAYFCGPTPKSAADEIHHNAKTGDFSDPSFPDTQAKLAEDIALEYLNTLTKHIWPGLWKAGQKEFDFSQLVDLNNGNGQARFYSQFFLTNIDPTELYVMSLTDSSKHRIKTNKTGYDNLYITGDWIDCGFNAGCIEATVMSGKQAARAISGKYIEIPGENDL